MKTLKVFRINDIDRNDVEKLHSVLNEQQKHALEFYLWENENDFKPKVSFSLAHNNRSVFLKFFVEEKEIRVVVTKINGAVWQDSCVEFFVSLDEKGYYNFEFNCLGTVLAAFGKNRNERTFLSENVLTKIETHTKLSKKKDGFKWELLIVIPTEIFIHHSLQSLSGMVCKGNFYKCGDGLLQPHYLSWLNVETEKPDFHLPRFFGEIAFE
jgi:hypothetical protein